MVAVPTKNPVPTSGQLRGAWANAQRALRPALPHLRDSGYLAVGVVLATVTLRALRGTIRLSPAELSQDGEQTLHTLREQPVFHAASVRLGELTADAAETTQRVTDDAHDSVEELYYRIDQLTRTLARGLTAAPTRLWTLMFGRSPRSDLRTLRSPHRPQR